MKLPLVTFIIPLAALAAASGLVAQQPFELDASFEFSNVNETAVVSILATDTGDVILSGSFDIPGLPNTRRLVALDEQAAIIPSFDATGYGDGLLTPYQNGFFVRNGQGIRKMLNNGTLDPSFSAINVPYFNVSQGGTYHVLPDGSVLLGGQHWLSDSIRGFLGPHSLIWLTNTGYLDTTKTHRAALFPVWTMKEQIDGKFMLSTSGGTYEGYNAGSVLRVHPDGARDTTFQSPIFFERAHDIVTLPSGKYLVGGGFKFQQNSPDTLGLIRLNHDGSLDSTFHIPYFQVTYQPWNLGRCSDILDLGDGRIIVTGGFDFVDGEPRGGICMLDTNGNLLNDAFVGAEAGPWFWGTSMIERRSIIGITQAPDGSFYIYGSYHGYNDGTNNYPGQRMISRLYGLNVGVNEQDDALRQAQDDILFIYPNPGNDQLNIRLPHSERSGTIRLFDAAGRVYLQQKIAAQNTLLNTNRLPRGLYLVAYTNNDGRIWRTRWVKE